MHIVHRGPLAGLVGQAALLLLLAGTVGLTGVGWVVGLICGVTATAVLSYGLDHFGAPLLGPADRVTLTRTVLVGGVTALVADAFVRPAALTALVALAAVALVLDGVDGWVARRTGTSSALGARFDMEVDAFLILVLSLHVAREVGPWVLAIGAARYLFVAAGWLLPWMRGTLPARYWRKPVAATQGIVLTVVAADVLPRVAEDVAIVVALALLAESFGRDVWWLWRQRAASATEGATVEAVSSPVGR
ncbi:MAG: CDP-alcohol phosphatidyltransferase family protein [Friedmanniella sp.]